jgi:hypothetical protein
MSNFVLDALGLFRKKRITKTPLSSDFIMLASTNVGNRSRETQGQMRSRLIRATDLGQTCPPVYKDAVEGIKDGEPDPYNLQVDGENCHQYWKVKLNTEGIYSILVGTQTGKSPVIAPPAGTYIIIVEYGAGTIGVGNVKGIEWPLDIEPTWTNTSGSRDIITVVSDGEITRGVATLGYTS